MYSSLSSSFLIIVNLIVISNGAFNIFKRAPDSFDLKYGSFSEDLRLQMLEEAREMFYFGYNSYMNYAYPMDELNPLRCSGRGPDRDDPDNININDILGDYCLTLVDSLDTLAVLGNASEFQDAVTRVVEHVNFDKDNVVQVFEANIRVLGGLISAHMLMMDPEKPFGDLRPPWYDGELLHLAHDLASRLLPAFEKSLTGLPFPRVNLRRGVPEAAGTVTCTAGAGSLVLEFGLLSRLLNDPVYEGYARRANKVLWNFRSRTTGLLGNMIDVDTGSWMGRLSGLGAGMDSFYEYLLKTYIMFGEKEDFEMFSEAYDLIKRYMRIGREHCNQGSGDHPLYVNVDMLNGHIHNSWIDSLQAAFAGVQVLSGDIEEAICAHALYYAIWKRYGVLPERFNWKRLTADVAFYPLRPELVESTYLLYQATKNPFYLHVGMDILHSLNNLTRAPCGYATVHSVEDMSLEDRMESFFLSETCKYLYLLFDKDNHVNKHFHKYVFSTEGHLFSIDEKFRTKTWENIDIMRRRVITRRVRIQPDAVPFKYNYTCDAVHAERKYYLPLKSHYLAQIANTFDLEDYWTDFN